MTDDAEKPATEFSAATDAAAIIMAVGVPIGQIAAAKIQARSNERIARDQASDKED